MSASKGAYINSMKSPQNKQVCGGTGADPEIEEGGGIHIDRVTNMKNQSPDFEQLTRHA